MSNSSSKKPENDEITSPSNQQVVVYQQFLRMFDEMSFQDKQLLLILTSAFVAMSDAEKTVIVAAAERMAGFMS